MNDSLTQELLLDLNLEDSLQNRRILQINQRYLEIQQIAYLIHLEVPFRSRHDFQVVDFPPPSTTLINLLNLPTISGNLNRLRSYYNSDYDDPIYEFEETPPIQSFINSNKKGFYSVRNDLIWQQLNPTCEKCVSLHFYIDNIYKKSNLIGQEELEALSLIRFHIENL